MRQQFPGFVAILVGTVHEVNQAVCLREHGSRLYSRLCASL